jgi:hypothetical protein
MPLYVTPSAGNTARGVFPLQSFTLFDGTETPSAGVKSVAFQALPSSAPKISAGQVFVVTFPSSPTATVQIQASNDDVDGHYQTLTTTVTATQNSYYADYGEFKFYRAVINAYASGGMPIVTVQR